MKLFLKFLLLSILFLSIVTNAQSTKKYSLLDSEKNEENLKDSVKSVLTYYSKINEALPRTFRNKVLVFNGAYTPYEYIELNRNGLSTMTIAGKPNDLGIRNFDLKAPYVSYFDYDSKDLEKKKIYKTVTKKYYPINDCLRVMPNENYYNYSKDFDSTGVNLINKKELVQSIYVYESDNKGRIKEALEYTLYPSDTIPIKKYNKENLEYRILFFYNEKNQVINQKIIGVVIDETLVNTPVFHALSTESGFSDDLQMKYKYDEKGRIIQVLLFGEGQTIAKEDYIYHPIKDYIQKVKCYVTGPGEISNPTKNFVKTFNEQGDMIKKEFIPNSPQQNIAIKEYYYSYEYDSHNNWIKCNMYLEGTKEGEPSLVAERKIEYYN